MAQLGGKVGFNVVGNDVTVPAGKAYLDLSASGVKGFLAFDLSGEETAIEGIEANDVKAEIYNLAGQRVKKAQRGIYIVGGKKVFVK